MTLREMPLREMPLRYMPCRKPSMPRRLFEAGFQAVARLLPAVSR